MIPLLIHRSAPDSVSNGRPRSLLTLPVGRGCLLEQVAAFADFADADEILVLTSGKNDLLDSDLLESTKTASVKVVQPDTLGDALSRFEPADEVVVMDPACWPVEGFDLAELARRFGEYRGATHIIALDGDQDHARERVELDAGGDLRRIQRYYDSVNWPEVANASIVLSIVPVQALRCISFRSLVGLRSALSTRGVLNRDIPVDLKVDDLTREEGLLALNEHVLTKAAGCGLPAESSNGSLSVGKGCLIHSSARTIGPVVVQDGATIEQNVTIVGPTVLGPNSTVRSGATVIQCVLTSHATLPSGTVVRQRLLSGNGEDLAMRFSSGRVSQVSFRSTGTQLDIDRSFARSAGSPSGGQRIQLVLKRAMDILLTFLGLLVLAPLLIAVGVLIKWESHGPVFFRHRREGKDGVEFACLKFRTMVDNAHVQQRRLYEENLLDGPQFKVTDDPRVTRAGRWLRATNIDELPQLINVLLGDMSLVGPRPSPFRENQICVPWRRARLSVRPGITGLWQICRSDDRSQGDFHEWIFYDISYVRHFSFWLDIKILFATLLTLGGRWRVPIRWMTRRERTEMARVPGAAISHPAPQA